MNDDSPNFSKGLVRGGRMKPTLVLTSILLLLAGTRLITVKAAVPERTFKLTGESPNFWKLFDHDAALSRVAGDFGFTEGPVWDESGFLYVSDEVQNKIYRVFTDGPKADELLFVLVMTTGARIHNRAGGLKAADVKGEDGLR